MVVAAWRPPKRKRPQDETPTEAESATRRTTRHSHPTTLHPDNEPEKQLRSRRVRSDTHEALDPVSPPSAATPTAAAPTTKTYVTRPRDTKTSSDPDTAAAPRPKVANATITNRRTRRRSAADDHADPADPASLDHQIEGKENLQPAHHADSKHVAAATPQPQHSPVPPHPRSRAPAPKSPASLDDPVAAYRGAGTSMITPKRRLSIQPKKPPPTPRSDRNIDRVVLGDISFRAWYPSYYGKDVLGDASVTSGGKANPGGGGAKIGGGKKDKEVLLDRLFVCPSCFKYSKEEVKWRRHTSACLPKAWVPGDKIYIHPKENSISQGTSGSDARRNRRPKKGDDGGSVHGMEGEWSVWEVDGENEPLFCQNLSLFAKLFLDNKSVFFDVAGFNYFLLVYTPPHTAATTRPEAVDCEEGQPREEEITPPRLSSRPQVVGFFSKEKLSWDNNNLACILVFPPWQRKGLGALLMGISYEISRREKVLGGPEKPISELGKKGYRRFWAGEICRWLLTLGPQDSSGKEEEGIVVDVDECSKSTWIAPEDCLIVIRDMGIMVIEDETGAAKSGTRSPIAEGEDETDLEEGKRPISRVRIDKEDVRRWVQDNRIDMERACDPDGFVEGYAIKSIEEGEEEEEEE
ncbi:Histone acetyltransferase [Apiospora rasikravindrae]|uniref:histone acetyltransferase n=1 Tax=Apiospora rasikravindrae TaxID=990691 RepID=A0ABR1U7A8_9PEZI